MTIEYAGKQNLVAARPPRVTTLGTLAIVLGVLGAISYGVLAALGWVGGEIAASSGGSRISPEWWARILCRLAVAASWAAGAVAGIVALAGPAAGLRWWGVAHVSVTVAAAGTLAAVQAFVYEDVTSEIGLIAVGMIVLGLLLNLPLAILCAVMLGPSDVG